MAKFKWEAARKRDLSKRPKTYRLRISGSPRRSRTQERTTVMEAVEGQMGQGMYRGFLLAARKKSEEIKEIENALRRLSPDQIQELADSLSQPPKAHLQIESPRSGEVVLAQRISNAQASAAKRKAAAAAKKAAATPTSTVDIVSESRKKIAEVEGQFNKGIITDGERYSKVVDIIAKLEAVSLFKKAACRRSGTSA